MHKLLALTLILLSTSANAATVTGLSVTSDAQAYNFRVEFSTAPDLVTVDSAGRPRDGFYFEFPAYRLLVPYGTPFTVSGNAINVSIPLTNPLLAAYSFEHAIFGAWDAVEWAGTVNGGPAHIAINSAVPLPGAFMLFAGGLGFLALLKKKPPTA